MNETSELNKTVENVRTENLVAVQEISVSVTVILDSVGKVK